MQARIFNGFGRLGIQPGGVGIAFAANVGCHRAFQFRLTQLLEGGGTEHGVIERGSAEADDGILVRAFETFLISTRHP